MFGILKALKFEWKEIEILICFVSWQQNERKTFLGIKR